MRQLIDLLEWALLIAVLLAVVVFTPRLAAYVSASIPASHGAHLPGADAEPDAEVAATTAVDLSFAPDSSR
ncbi:hypothetical protein OJF2_76240 [Aquisphaera giovannonii]|uniref:Uncharacterized protein n=1 Tax=Aquisphaera giovannonii TaxID=406548 RepID=A0A5B9WEK4_9BACT|nr:hypothetical protein [Aquisphaera giovannonii]QEH39012.1 hypothetical protein OJF2_76240 [Aquisphaera giovannonii]